MLALALGLGGLALARRVKPSPQTAQASSRPVNRSDAKNACETLERRLCRDVGETSSACALAGRDLGGFSAARCNDMLGRYAQVARELRQLDEGTRELTAPRPLSPHGTAPLLGSPDAELTLVVFADFQSPDCARASPLARIATNLYPGRVRVVFRQYPSPKHPDAQLAAEASLAAHAQGKFWAYHDALFANPHELQRAALERYATEVGLDMVEFRHALDTHRFAADVDADVELAHKVQALERPSVYVNAQPVSVPYGVSELSKLIETTGL